MPDQEDNPPSDNEQDTEIHLKGLKLISVFTGDDDKKQEVGDWLETIEQVADIGRWTDAQKVLIAKSRCRGEAYRFLKLEDDVRNASTFAEFAEAMRNRFKPELP